MTARDYLDWFIGGRLRHAGPDTARRARLVVWVSLVAAFTALFHAAIHLLFGSAVVAGVGIGAALVLGAVPYVLRSSSNVTLAGNLLTGVGFAMISYTAWMRGVPGTSMMNVLCVPPLVALVLAGTRSGFVWFVLSLLQIAGLGLVAILGGDFSDQAALDQQEAVSVVMPLVFVGVVFAIGMIYENVKNETFNELEDQRVQSQMLMAAIPDLIFRLDPKGVIVDAKIPPATPLPEALVGLDIHEVFPRLDLGVSLEEEAGEGRLRVFETRLSLGQEVRDYEIHALSVQNAGLVLVLRDMTARNRARERLLEAERRRVEDEAEIKVARAGRMAQVGALAAGVAHEINNPLSFVMANIEYVKTQLGEVEPEILDALGDAEAGARQIRTIVRDIAVFAGSDEEETLEPLDVHDALESALNLVSNEIRHKALVTRQFDRKLPLVSGNAARLGQVFVNLLFNAAQSIPEDERSGLIRVITRGVEGGVAVDIEDNGEGMDPPAIDKALVPFFTTREEGRGLGLPISLEILERLGGHMEITSQPGKGTRVTVVLEISDVQDRAKPLPIAPVEPTPLPPDDPVGRVLVVDDDVMVTRAIARTLKRFEVVAATSGEDALELLGEDGLFDVILCDVNMPGLSGMDLYNRIRSLQPHLEPRFLFLTGGAMQGVQKQFLEGLDERRVIFKPPSSEVLIDTLHRMVGDASVSDPSRKV